MNRVMLSLGLLTLLCTPAGAQVFGRRATVTAAGTGTVTIKPDLLRVSVSVVTMGSTAQEASDANATLANTVIAQLTRLVGATGDIKTTGYSVSPNYKYPSGGGNPTLTGYTATNSIQASSPDLSLAGRIIDTATQAGASSVGSLIFTLKDPEPAKREALRAATVQARAHADAIAAGLGLQVGAIISAGETGASVPVVRSTTLGAAAVDSTTIQPGNLEITAYVTIEAELGS